MIMAIQVWILQQMKWPPQLYLEVEVQQNYHLFLGGLEEGVFDVRVQDVHLVSLDSGVAQTISVCLQSTLL